MNSKQTNELALWDLQACVRTLPYRYMLREEDLYSELFPREILPLSESEIDSLPQDLRNKLLAYALIDFLDYTTALEHTIVNPAFSAIGNSGLFSILKEKHRIQALQFYTDEGYHAYFSYRLSAEVGYLLDIPKIKRNPARLELLSKIKSKNPNHRHSEIIVCFLKAFVSETLIAKELSEFHSPSIARPVLDMLKDHTYDEARHCAFFCQIFTELHRHYPLDEYIPTLLDILDVFFKPDRAQLERFIIVLRLEGDRANKIIEKAADKLIKSKKSRCATPIRLLKKLGIYEKWEGEITCRGYI